jgi:predicted dehydrogenase
MEFDMYRSPLASLSGSRRSFLSRAAAIGTTAFLAGKAGAITFTPLPGVKARPSKPPSANDPIRLGIIGTGGMGTGHAVTFANFVKNGQENIEFTALADVCTLHAESCKKKIIDVLPTANPEVYQDYRKLLAREDIHAVLIASPEHWHAKHAMDAIAAGKDVYLEKPMTLHLQDALNVQAAAQKNPHLVIQVGTQMMQLPRYHKAREVIASGLIGEPTMSQTSYCRNSKDGEWNYYTLNPDWKPGVNLDWEGWLGDAPKRDWDPLIFARWRRYREFSTGIIGDLLVHVMSPLVLAIDRGAPTRVVASGGHVVDKTMENHDQMTLTVNFEKPHTMIVAGSTNNEVGLETIIRGHKGNIYLGGRHCVVRPERIYAEEFDQQEIQCEDIGNDQDVHRRMWLKNIRSREMPMASIELGTKIMTIVDLATRSLWDGKAWEYDPGTMTARAI